MPAVRKLTDEGRRREKNKKRDETFRAWMGAVKAMTGKTYEEIGRMMRISGRTVQKRVSLPETMTIGELRMLNDSLPEGRKIPAEVVGL